MFVLDLQSSHVQAVLTGLSPVERALMLGHLGIKPDEYADRWVAAVSKLPVRDAIHLIRSSLSVMVGNLARVNFCTGGPS